VSHTSSYTSCRTSQIEVRFDIDAHGVLHVAAKDPGTGKEQKITITSSSGLSKEEVERMRREAETHASEDQQQRELIEARNEAENALYRTKRMLKENQSLFSAARSRIETAAADLKRAVETLNAAWQEVSADLYKQAGTKTGPQEQPPRGSSGEGPIIDAEVVDEKR
jgi:molecular chaperone DnaK